MDELENVTIDLWGNKSIQKSSLRERFIYNPFSVIDLKDRQLQKRKNKWMSLGIKSEIGRDNAIYGYGGRNKKNRTQQVLNNAYDNIWNKGSKNFYDKMTGGNNVSIFNPVISEILYRWFCPNKGYIFDPFAGGSVRGIVAHYLGYKYSGIELRPEQVASNREQALNILPINNQPQWYIGDSDKLLNNLWNDRFDFIFSCPPYADLEVYSDLPDDLSNMDYKDFLIKYRSIISKSLQLLKKNCYACFVVGDIRDKKNGQYKLFVRDTINAFCDNNEVVLWNEIILLQPLGNAGIRVNMKNKKVTRIHQNILVFKKL